MLRARFRRRAKKYISATFKQLVQDGDFYEYLEQFGDMRTRVPLTDYSALRVLYRRPET
ncbi:hypothetical protein Peur_052066 [Populus x canadensis]